MILFLGFWFLLLALQEGCYEKAHEVRGLVIEKGFKRGTNGVGRAASGAKSYRWVRYRFTTAEGETKEHTDREVLPGTWSELREGGPVDIEYLASAADSRVAGQRASQSTHFMIAIGLLVAGAAVLRKAHRANSKDHPRDLDQGT